MNILYNKKAVKISLFCIVVISIFELYCGFQVARHYRGTYYVTIFVPFLIQPYCYYLFLFKNTKKHLKIRIIGITLISLVLPLTIYYTLPNYTYNDGKRLIEDYIKLDKEIVFIDYSFSKSTIPALNNKKMMLGTNRVYYYHIISGEKSNYYIVDAVSGKVTQLADEYWQE